MNVYVYPTNSEWYRFLSAEPHVDEVNFWRPGGKQPFQQLAPGDLLLFRLNKPRPAIAGGGTYTHFSFAPLTKSWEAFGRKNGTATFERLVQLIGAYRDLGETPEQVANAIIGNIVLTAPFFLSQDRWIPVPTDYEQNSPQGQRFDASHGSGKSLLEAFQTAISDLGGRRVSEPAYVSRDEEMRFGTAVVKRRLGQGGFAFLVADNYEKRCAVSGERTYPVLEAAHIKPVQHGGLHRPDNGILLRSDIHKLFDHGYVTVRPNGAFAVSTRLAEDWHNGRIYYELGGQQIRLPASRDAHPAREFLEWHNDTVFQG